MSGRRGKRDESQLASVQSSSSATGTRLRRRRADPTSNVVPGAVAVRGPGDVEETGTITFGSGDTIAPQAPVTLEATPVDTEAENRILYENELLRQQRDQLLQERERLRQEQELLRQGQGQGQLAQVQEQDQLPHRDQDQEDNRSPMCHLTGRKRWYALGATAIIVIIAAIVAGVVLSLNSTSSPDPKSQASEGDSQVSTPRPVTNPRKTSHACETENSWKEGVRKIWLLIEQSWPVQTLVHGSMNGSVTIYK